MCFKKPKPDPVIKEQQEEQKAEVKAKREEEVQVAETARKQQLEETKQTQKTEAQIAKTQEDQQARQQELAKPAAKPKSLVSTVKATEIAPTPEPETIVEPVKQQEVKGSELTATGLAAKPKAPSSAMLRRRSRRTGRGRRSLLTSSAGGVGYFSRFL